MVGFAPIFIAPRSADAMMTLEFGIDYPDEGTAMSVMVSPDPENAGNVASELRGSKLLFSFS